MVYTGGGLAQALDAFEFRRIERIELMRRSNIVRNLFIVLVLVIASCGIAFTQVTSVDTQRQTEQVIVELTTEGIKQTTTVPIDTKQAVGMVNVSGGGEARVIGNSDRAEKTRHRYVLSVYRIERNRVFLRLRVDTNSGNRVERNFSVSRARASEYQFEQGIKVRAYYEFVTAYPTQGLIAKVDEYMNAAVRAGKFSGSILVAQNGKVLVSKGYGAANIELDVPNTSQTKFRIGSLTKQFTAAAIVMLQERGKLSVQDSICRYMPQCPSAWQPITIHHVLTHSSGLPDVSRFAEFETLVL